MKSLLALTLLFTSLFVYAQPKAEPPVNAKPAAASVSLPDAPAPASEALASNVYAAGVSYNNGATPELAGTALYAHLLSAKTGTYGFTVFDALPTTTQPFSVTTNVGAGVAQKAFSVGKVGIFVPASAGFTFKGGNSGWNWSAGALASIKVYDNFRIYPNIRFLKSSVNQNSGVQPILGVLFGFAK